MADGMERRGAAEGPAGGEGNEDGAERAFEALRAEVAALRQAVARAGAELPDYSPTLGAIAQELRGVGARLAALERAPALATSAAEQAEGLRRTLQGVGEDARRGLGQSQGRLDEAVRELRGVVGGARERREQRRWLWGVGAAGTLGGVVLWLLATALLPWGLGTRLAGLAYGGRWEGGQALLREASPGTWDRMVRLYRACPQGSATELCEAALAVRTIAPGAPQPGTAPPAAASVPEGGKEPAAGAAAGPARGRPGR